MFDLNNRLQGDEPLHLWEALAEEYREARIASGQADDLPEDLAASSVPLDDAEAESKLFEFFHRKHRTALCLSGGGVRSATLAIGVLQGLAQASAAGTGSEGARGVFQEFDFLSTVSGGGYAGSWFSAWARRKGLDSVTKQLARQNCSSTLDPEPSPLRHLRRYVAFLDPKLGILSADTWALAATVLRNMILNWLVLIPILMVVVLLPSIFEQLTRWSPAGEAGCITLFAGLISAAVAAGYVVYHLPTFYGDNGPGDLTYIAGALFPLTLAALLLSLHWAWLTAVEPNYSPFRFAAYGAGIHLAGTLFAILLLAASRKNRPVRKMQSPVIWALWGLVVAAASGAAAGWLTYLVSTVFDPGPFKWTFDRNAFVCVCVPVILGAFLAAATLAVGLASKFTSDQDREWWARAGAWLMIVAFAWGLLSALVMYGPSLLQRLVNQTVAVISAGGLGGVASWLGHSDKTPAQGTQPEAGPSGFSLRNILAHVLGPAFLVLLVILLAEGNEFMLGKLCGFGLSRAMGFLIWFAILGGIAALSSCFVNVNRFSLHAMYRARLVRTYLGASTDDRDAHVNRFTNLGEADEVYMHELLRKPLHVVNMALNLVGGKNLAWQQRKAETFTSTCLRTGSARLRYQSTKSYASARSSTGFSLGTAVAISGAAASPNMGYHSSPVISFVMMLFNARLGWWLANPGEPGRGAWNKDGPTNSLFPILNEMLGRTNDESDWVYLSDGGHFENLGLYEMVLRRCATIVIVDGSGDPDYNFEDLGNAIRKVRVDLGISIEFGDGIPIYGPRDVRNRYCAVGRIRYDLADSNGSMGRILYVKACLNGTEPVDVRHYAANNPDFPQQGTEQLWFDEAQFESYRRLGSHIIQQIAQPPRPGDPLSIASLAELADRSETFVRGFDLAPHSRWPQPSKSRVDFAGTLKADSLVLSGTVSEE